MHKRFRSNDVKDASIFGSNVCLSSNVTCLLLILYAYSWGLKETPSAKLGFKTCSGLVWICYNNAQPFCSGVGEVEQHENVG